jgi:hypothetical protein
VWSKFSRGLEFFILEQISCLEKLILVAFLLSSSLGEFGGGLIFSVIGGFSLFLCGQFFGVEAFILELGEFGLQGQILMPYFGHFSCWSM